MRSWTVEIIVAAIAIIVQIVPPSATVTTKAPVVCQYQDVSGTARTEFPAGSEVRIIGDGFGRKRGSVEFNNASLRVLSWKPTVIRVRAPDTPSEDCGYLIVRAKHGSYASRGFRVTATAS